MALTEDDLPDEWTLNYGGFVTIGDLVMATCRVCYGCVFSDFFTQHTHRHVQFEGVHLEKRVQPVAIGPDGREL